MKLTGGKSSQDTTRIKVRGAAQNNLKGIDLDIDIGRFVVVTGVSGAGKSSFAFDTLYAEGQRRYVETFSPYSRQFLERMGRPNVSAIENIPPSIAIDQNNPIKNSRSTVGTITELADYLKLVYAKAAVLYCANCSKVVERQDADWVGRWLEKNYLGKKVMLGIGMDVWKGIEPENFLSMLHEQGIRRVFSKKKLLKIHEYMDTDSDDAATAVVDMVTVAKTSMGRIVDSLEQCQEFGLGCVHVVIDDGQVVRFSRSYQCSSCGIDYDPPVANLFSFNSPIGACPTCKGFGRTMGIDMEKVIPDQSLSLKDGAIKPWRSGKIAGRCKRDLNRFCKAHGISLTKPFSKLSKKHHDWIIEGHDDFYGVRGFFSWLERKSYKMHVRVLLSRYRSYDVCGSCKGARLKPEALQYRLAGRTIAEVLSLPINTAREFFQAYEPPDHLSKALAPLLGEIRSRLKFLDDVGVGYLSLDRQSRTLSGGEMQRVDLARALGGALVNTLYVLDEPSIGLHPRDVGRLLEVLDALKNKANTLVVVEHDRQIIKAADFVLEMGPGPGEAGGRVVFWGSPAQLMKSRQTPTAIALVSGSNGKLRSRSRRKSSEFIRVKGAAEHNLKNLDIDIPLGMLVAITGVSGCGKSTLVVDVLFKGIKRAKQKSDERPGKFQALVGLEKIEDVILVDQSSVPKTPSTNPVSYIKALAPIRALFASTDKALARGFGPGDFSFRSGNGRCQTCQGSGHEKVEMQFLSDVYLPCPDCAGSRYSQQLLEVTLDGLSMTQVLDLTVDQAVVFFDGHRSICDRLAQLQKVGLGYLKLGQPANTLSGGEAQRMKLASQLVKPSARSSVGKKMFLLDEPTTGLHSKDIEKLLNVLDELISLGHSVVVIEHNPDVILHADHIIDLGPEGGDKGGTIVCQGTPEEVSRCDLSYTGAFLGRFYGLVHEDCEMKQTWRLDPDDGRIRVSGAEQNNLRSVNLTIPRGKLIAVTGVSGSGKSSLAFDVLFAEGQRRYLESVSAYARQFVSQLPRPKVEAITGLPPTVALEQRTSRGSGRATLATMTEIYHFLRLLFSKVGVQYCPECDVAVKPQSRSGILNGILKNHNGMLRVFAPMVKGKKGFHAELFEWARNKGIGKARVDGKIRVIKQGMKLQRYKEHHVELLLGQVELSRANRKEVRALVDEALDMADGTTLVISEVGMSFHSEKGACPLCGKSFAPLDPRSFSFNSPRGACDTCGGRGVVGEDEYQDVCPDCHGARLCKDSLAVKIDSKTITSVVRQTPRGASRLLNGLRIPKRLEPVARPLLKEIKNRLSFLESLGLSYLTLDRSGDSLSGGEAQRIRLAAQMGSNLRGVCYVLDEPTIGLHPVDTIRLVQILEKLRDKGNTIVVVEHDEEVVRSADLVLDLGPGAGLNGGTLVAQTDPKQLERSSQSVTGQWLSEHKSGYTGKNRAKPDLSLKVVGARHNNLKNISVEFPIGRFTCVTGLSGSGKSSLVVGVLYRGVKARLSRAQLTTPEEHKDILGTEHVKRVLLVDQSPIGRTPRSSVVTYVGIFEYLRKLFAALPESRMRGYSPSRFSFNVEGGRCSKCKGQGRVRLEMNFLPDAYVTCDRCGGARYNSDTLAIRYRTRNMADILDMSVEEAAEFFSSFPEVKKRLDLLSRMGLGYLTLGQTSPTLSGGEAQRLKLVNELSKSGASRTLYVLEEPTTGLHPSDVQRLVAVIQDLVDRGDTVVVVEHNMQLVAQADHVIDLGPGAGKSGGQVVAFGTPVEIAYGKSASKTARFLRMALGISKSPGKKK